LTVLISMSKLEHIAKFYTDIHNEEKAKHLEKWLEGISDPEEALYETLEAIHHGAAKIVKKDSSL
jgi:hypothetical protein